MKKITIIAIIITTLAISYFFFIFMPSQKLVQKKQERQAFLFSKKTECMKICQSLFEDDRSSLPENTGGYISLEPNGLTKRVVDCQTNEEVLTFMTINDEVFTSFCDSCVNSVEEYDRKEKEYIGN